VRKLLNLQVFTASVLMTSGLLLSGCKSTPELTQANASTLIQAYYDQQPAEGMIISVNEMGLKQGLTAGYWKLTKVYPNKVWADYTLTDDGKKALALNGASTVIEWRPDTEGKGHFFVTTVATNHLKAKDVQAPEDDVVGVDTAKTAAFTQSVNMTGVPQPLQDIAHNPGNTISSRRHADFTYENGAWKVHSIH
jgi:hypothetical protein